MQDLITVQRATVQRFYSRVADAVRPWLPTRPTLRHGLAWAGMRPGTYHTLYIGAYLGSFDEPGRYGPAIPRIYLNHYDLRVSQARERAWSKLHGQRCEWGQSSHQLELTTTIAELVNFAPWVACWARATETGDRDLLPEIPHPLERQPADLMKTDYLWTLAAETEYRPRERARAEARAARIRRYEQRATA